VSPTFQDLSNDTTCSQIKSHVPVPLNLFSKDITSLFNTAFAHYAVGPKKSRLGAKMTRAGPRAGFKPLALDPRAGSKFKESHLRYRMPSPYNCLKFRKKLLFYNICWMKGGRGKIYHVKSFKVFQILYKCTFLGYLKFRKNVPTSCNIFVCV